MLTRFINWLVMKTPAYKTLADHSDRMVTIAHIYGRALDDVIAAGGSVKVPNGTTKKVIRLAAQAMIDARKAA